MNFRCLDGGTSMLLKKFSEKDVIVQTDRRKYFSLLSSRSAQGGVGSLRNIVCGNTTAVLLAVLLNGCITAEPSAADQNAQQQDTDIFDDYWEDDSYDDDQEDGGSETDQCPEDPDKLLPGICGCGIADSDTGDDDEDGWPNCIDECPYDPDKFEPDDCGCGVAESDIDNDGTSDCLDECPNDANKNEEGDCGCGMDDTDSDGDGLADCLDSCPYDAEKTSPGDCGCGQPEDTCGSCSNTLLSKERLYAGEYLCSENGEFMFGLRDDGDLALWSEDATLWSAGTSGASYLHMQLLGNLVVYDENIQPLWASNTSGNQGAYLTLEDDGRAIVWLAGENLWEIGGDV